MNVAEVIVDVPTMQTNTPYSYLIPSNLTGKIKLGMRVVVPFGNSNRKIEGFVVGLKNETEDKNRQLKSIINIMDLDPVLTKELIDLSKWMANKTYSFQISCLLTMLPNVMKAKYQSTVKKIGKITDPELAAKFENQAEIPFDDEHFTKTEIGKLTDLRKNDLVKVIYHVKNKAVSKKENAILNKITDFTAVKNSIRKNASAQLKLLKILSEFPSKKLSYHVLSEKYGITNSTINNFIKKGYVKKTSIEKYRNPYKKKIVPDVPKKLTDDQNNAVTQIDKSIANCKANVFLLEGVTGSGKTEVYLQSIQTALNDKRQALMLVPEIALTPQMVNRVKSRFGDQVAIMHSGLSNGEKYDEWRRINEGKASVVVGARSAVFAPLRNIGLIILDEEHDSSYKQDDNPRYHTLDVAIWRAAYNKCPVVLGSATPSLESRARAEKGVYNLLELPKRINNQELPEVSIVDMTNEISRNGDIFSNELIENIKTVISRNEQAVLMLNRRGFSSFMMCRDCGHVLMCPNCDISLTMHLDNHTMKCHYCGFEEPIPNTCPNCHSKNIRYFGTGTEKAEEQLKKMLPAAKVLRMDVDTTKKKGAHERILQQFGAHEADILLGTQMIAKGLDFPDVTLVGVLNADTGLDLPDFRASEHTFDLLTQVAGRAGRANKNGRVIIQTFNPDNYAIKLASKQDYELFFRKEMQLRHMAGYSPYFFTIKVTVSSLDEKQAAKEAYDIGNYLEDNLNKETKMLGPTPRPIARIKRRFYYQIIIKYKHDEKLATSLKNIQQISQKKVRQGLRIAIDSEPVNFM